MRYTDAQRLTVNSERVRVRERKRIQKEKDLYKLYSAEQNKYS